MATDLTRCEERANWLSHGIGFLLTLAATPILIIAASITGGAAEIVGSSVFGASMMLLYFASTWYHLTPASRLKLHLQKIDHAAIFILIAGTYTPFTLGILRGAWGWTLFGLVWSGAVGGVCAKLLFGIRWPRLSTWMYLIMGWLILIAIRPLFLTMPYTGIMWLATGGLLYSLGVIFYASTRLRYAHFIWHLFVLGGSTCHFFAVLWYSA